MMRRISLSLAITLVATHLSAAPKPQSFLRGNPDDFTHSKAISGGYALMGGGGDVDEAFRWLLKKADGGDVVVLRASGSDGYNDYLFRELGITVDSVETLLFTSKKQSQHPSVARKLEGAEMIFIAGGDQSRYIRYWKDTPVEDLINAHARAGKPIGGTSAGLAIIGGYSYSAMHQGDLTSKLAVKYPNHKYITIEDDFLKLPLLTNILTDSHFSERNRQGRLLVMLRKIALDYEDLVITGIGVDEATALCIDANGGAKVISEVEGGTHFIRVHQADPIDVEATQASMSTRSPRDGSFRFTEMLSMLAANPQNNNPIQTMEDIK
ncbi:MAG: cyanophycinase [Symploca sp. SIO2D2]|nr:cyanophycinase [Symploca sp. SIO2D2]